MKALQRAFWRGLDPDAPAFVNRTCNGCGEKFTLDPLETPRRPDPPDVWRCARCRAK